MRPLASAVARACPLWVVCSRSPKIDNFELTFRRERREPARGGRRRAAGVRKLDMKPLSRRDVPPSEEERPASRDIGQRRLVMGLVVVVLALGAILFAHDIRYLGILFELPWLLVPFPALLAVPAVLGWAIAWSVEGVARTLGQTSTAVRRNTLLATCAVAALAILRLDQLERLAMPASSSPNEPRVFEPLPAEPASNEQVPIVSPGPSSIAIEAAKPGQSVPPAVEGLPPGEDTR